MEAGQVRWKSIVVSLVFGVILVLLMWPVEANRENLPGVLYGVLASVLGVLLSATLVSVLYEVWLRKDVGEEFRRLSGVSESASRAGLLWIGAAAKTSWKDVLRSSNEYLVVLQDPSIFSTRELQPILEVARKKKVLVRVFFPGKNAPYIPALEAILGRPAGSFGAICQQAQDAIAEAWTLAKQDPRDPVLSKSSLEIYELPSLPTATVVVTDRCGLLLTDTVTGLLAGTDGMALSIDAETDSHQMNWLRGEAERHAVPANLVDMR